MRVLTLEILWLVLLAPVFKHGVPLLVTLPGPLGLVLFLALFGLFFAGIAWIWARFSD